MHPKNQTHVVSEPPTEEATKVDIVAVHGLNGHCIRSWTHPNGFFWLGAIQNYIPEARVISFSGDMPIAQSRNFFDVSRELLAHIGRLRQGIKDPRRAIIFVAHSLGGLVVKAALAQATDSPRHNNIALSPRGIMFFGTPHRGASSSPSIFSFVQRIQQIVPSNSARDTIDLSVARSLLKLQDINHKFVYISQDILIASFYESKKSGPGAGYMVVEPSNARLDLPNEKQIALNRNHSNLITFSSADEVEFILVEAVLVEFAQILERRARHTSLLSLRSIIPSNRVAIDPVSQYALKVDIVKFKKLSRIATETAQEGTVIEDHTTVSNFLEVGLNGGAHKPVPVDIKAWWVHVPMNNSEWVYNFLRSITQTLKCELSIADDRFWLLNQLKGRDNKPHSRSMLPSCHTDTSKPTKDGLAKLDGCAQFALYIPYLHWDTLKCFEARAKFLKLVYDKKEPQIPAGLGQQQRTLYNIAKEFLNRAASFHPRRSLDQFFYSRLPDTSTRDSDQIVTKHTLLSEGGPKMIMVDQLWLWVVRPQDRNEHDQSALLTFFPQKEKEGEGDTQYQTADLKQSVLERFNELDDRDEHTDPFYLAALIVNQAVNVMLQVRNDHSLDILEIFREAIGEVTDLQTHFFRQFHNSVNRGQNVTHAQKKEELQVVLKVADIMDELNTIKRVLDVQHDVIKETITKHYVLYLSDYHPACQVLDNAKQDVIAYLTQIERMNADAKRTYDSLLSLLDLQQKEANIDEAHSSNELTKISLAQSRHAREQADATSAQSQILLLFTIVTIVFAPLSFFTSYFGMNVRSFTGDSGNKSLSQVWVVMGPASGVIIAVLMSVSVAIYLWSERRLTAKREQEDNSRNIKGF